MRESGEQLVDDDKTQPLEVQESTRGRSTPSGGAISGVKGGSKDYDKPRSSPHRRHTENDPASEAASSFGVNKAEGDSTAKCPNSVSDISQPVDLAKELKHIKDYRINRDVTPRYIEILCVLRDETEKWFPESLVQEANNPAVCTFWNSCESICRPSDKIPEEPLRVVSIKGNKAFVQMVGDPFFIGRGAREFFKLLEKRPQCAVNFRTIPRSISKEEAASKWPKLDLERPPPGFQRPGNLQMIFSHRKVLDPDRSQVYCLWSSGRGRPVQYGSWEDEDYIRQISGAAMVTYWESSSGLRGKECGEDPKIPESQSSFEEDGALHWDAQTFDKSTSRGRGKQNAGMGARITRIPYRKQK